MWNKFKTWISGTWLNRGIHELVLTFSSRPSLLSSKKLERFVLFINSLVLVNYYFFSKIATLSTTEMVTIVAMLFGYAGYSTYRTYKDKGSDVNSVTTTTDNITTDGSTTTTENVTSEVLPSVPIIENPTTSK